MMKLKYLVLCLLLTLTACGGDHQNACLPDNGSGANKSSSKEGDTLAEIDKFLLERKPVSTVIEKIKKKLFGTSNGFGTNGGTAKQLFESIVNSSEYRSAIGAAFTLYVLFYGLGITTGFIQASSGDIIIRIAKLGFVTALALSWDTFFSVIGNVFSGGRDELIGYMMDSFKSVYQASSVTVPTTNTNLFEDLDKFVAQIFSMHMFAILSALFSVFGENTGPYALGYFIFLLTGLIFLGEAIIMVITTYIFSLFANVILFAFAPLFLVFMLFEKTKSLFDGWLKQIINYNLQPVAMVAFLGLFVMMLQPFLVEILSLKVCYRAADASQQNAWRFVDDSGQDLNFGVNAAPPIDLRTLLMFFFLAWLFKGYLLVAEHIAYAISSTFSQKLSNIPIPALQSMMGKGDIGGALGMKRVG